MDTDQSPLYQRTLTTGNLPKNTYKRTLTKGRLPKQHLQKTLANGHRPKDTLQQDNCAAACFPITVAGFANFDWLLLLD